MAKKRFRPEQLISNSLRQIPSIDNPAERGGSRRGCFGVKELQLVWVFETEKVLNGFGAQATAVWPTTRVPPPREQPGAGSTRFRKAACTRADRQRNEVLLRTAT